MNATPATKTAAANRRRVVLIHVSSSKCVFAPSPYVELGIFPQLGLLYLAAVLREAGYEPQYIDTAYDEISAASLQRALSGDDVLFVGFYTNIALRADVCLLTREIRKFRPGLPVIIGGPGFIEAEHYFAAGANAVVGGEAEHVIVPLADRLRDGQPLQGIPGVTTPTSGPIHFSHVAPPTPDLDKIPYPAWDLAPPHKYYNHLSLQAKHPFYCIMASRGCHLRCDFCFHTYTGREARYRYRSVDSVIQEMALLYDRYRIRHVKFQDDIFGARREWLEEFCRRYIASGLPMTWNCSAYPVFFRKNPEPFLRLIRQAKCVSVHFGMQSATPNILRAQHRSHEEPDILAAITPFMKQIGFYTIVDFIYGLPGETEETMEHNLQWSLKSGVHMIQVNPLNVVPNTALADTYGTDERVPGLTAKQIEKAIARTNRVFFSRPQTYIDTMTYIMKYNPEFLLTLPRALPFGLRLAQGKFKMAQWRFSKPMADGSRPVDSYELLAAA